MGRGTPTHYDIVFASLWGMAITYFSVPRPVFTGLDAACFGLAAKISGWSDRNFPMKPIKQLLLLLPFLAACSNVPQVSSYLTPYRIDVRQGNFVTQEMVAQLKPGLTREQVRFILGSPLLVDMFHSDRWDYVYSFRSGSDELQQRRMAVFFQENKLTRIAGDVVAEDATPAAVAPPTTRLVDIPAAEGSAPAATDKK